MLNAQPGRKLRSVVMSREWAWWAKLGTGTTVHSRRAFPTPFQTGLFDQRRHAEGLENQLRVHAYTTRRHAAPDVEPQNGYPQAFSLLSPESRLRSFRTPQFSEAAWLLFRCGPQRTTLDLRRRASSKDRSNLVFVLCEIVLIQWRHHWQDRTVAEGLGSDVHLPRDGRLRTNNSITQATDVQGASIVYRAWNNRRICVALSGIGVDLMQ